MWWIKKLCYFELLPAKVGGVFKFMNSCEIYGYKSPNLPAEKVSY